MKQFFLSFIFIISLIITNQLAAQTGVAINSDGSAADGSAMLDVKASDKGILIPRVALTTSVTSPVNGLLVYQTGGTPGFYYYNGSAWIYIQNSGNTALNASNLTSGTVPIARLGASGTASATTFLRGDNTWAVPAGGSSGVTLDLIATITVPQNLGAGGSAVASTPVNFNTTNTSPAIAGASFNGTTYTVGQAGTYLIAVNLASTNTVVAGAWPVLYVNGSVVAYGTSGQSTNLPNSYSRATLTAVIILAAGNLVSVQASNTSTTATLTYTSDGTSRFTITKL
jgi:hypothetical protein